MPGPPAEVLLPAARILRVWGTVAGAAGAGRAGNTRLVEQVPQTPVGEAAVPLPAHLWRACW